MTMEAWAGQEYVGATGEQTLLQNAKALGGVDLLDKLLAMLSEYKPEEVATTELKGAHHDHSSY